MYKVPLWRGTNQLWPWESKPVPESTLNWLNLQLHQSSTSTGFWLVEKGYLRCLLLPLLTCCTAVDFGSICLASLPTLCRQTLPLLLKMTVIVTRSSFKKNFLLESRTCLPDTWVSLMEVKRVSMCMSWSCRIGHWILLPWIQLAQEGRLFCFCQNPPPS